MDSSSLGCVVVGQYGLRQIAGLKFPRRWETERSGRQNRQVQSAAVHLCGGWRLESASCPRVAGLGLRLEARGKGAAPTLQRLQNNWRMDLSTEDGMCTTRGTIDVVTVQADPRVAMRICSTTPLRVKQLGMVCFCSPSTSTESRKGSISERLIQHAPQSLVTFLPWARSPRGRWRHVERANLESIGKMRDSEDLLCLVPLDAGWRHLVVGCQLLCGSFGTSWSTTRKLVAGLVGVAVMLRWIGRP